MKKPLIVFFDELSEFTPEDYERVLEHIEAEKNKKGASHTKRGCALVPILPGEHLSSPAIRHEPKDYPGVAIIQIKKAPR